MLNLLIVKKEPLMLRYKGFIVIVLRVYTKIIFHLLNLSFIITY